MTTVNFYDESITLENNESVLDGLLRSGFSVPYGCKAGDCQSCKMVAKKGSVPAAAQKGLTDNEKILSEFLSCSCYPESDISVAFSDDDESTSHTAILKDITPLNDHILKLVIESEIDYFPGQYLTIWLDNTTARCYSIASIKNASNLIELHIKLIPDGAFKQHLDKQLNIGSTLNITGPYGDCFYSESAKEAPLLLAGIGTGLAPLYGILQDAISKEHQGDIHLVTAAKNDDQLYLIEELKSLESKHNNLSLSFLAQNVNNNDIAEQADIYQFVKDKHPNTAQYKVFLCGAESFVKKMKKQIFLSGANMQDISADAFVAST